MRVELDSRARKEGHVVQGAIVHAMGEYIGGVWAGDFLAKMGYSVHALIAPDGDLIEGVDPARVAYHAGVSQWQDYTVSHSLNETFLGCEFLVEGDHTLETLYAAMARDDCYTEDQYVMGGLLYAQWMRDFNIPEELILGHSMVAGDDVRGAGNGKRDPGDGFQWARLKEEIAKNL